MGEREREHINLDGYRDEASLGGTRGGEHDKKILYANFFNQKLYVPFKGSETAYCLQIIQFSYLSSLRSCV